MRCVLCLVLWVGQWGHAAVPLALDAEETAWVAAQRHRVITVTHDPGAGFDRFDYLGREAGLLTALLRDMQAELGLTFQLVRSRHWDHAYERFLRGEVDVLYGANPTPERLQIMRFTHAVQRYPYMVFARRDSVVQNLGDLDGKTLGFLAGDYVIGELPREYPNIVFKGTQFSTQTDGLRALVAGRIDGFVAAGGGIEYEYLLQHPEIVRIATLRTLTSDMTFAVSPDNAMLGRIIDRYLQQRAVQVEQLAQDAGRLYNRKALRLTAAELRWLEQDGTATVGVAEDYLPFDHFDQGQYKGIAGATLQRIAEIVGVRFQVVSAPFADLIEQARVGDIDVLNMAKTEDRLAHFRFPHAISTERDIVIGLKSRPPVQDVYSLDGQPVAVIDGFWHEEYLRKNLKNPQIVRTASIQESLRLVREGKAAYLIENPTVVEFYINGLGYTDLVKRGVTSKDSFIYFGVGKRQPELASIMDKVIPLIEFEEMKYLGVQTVPMVENEANRRLTFWLLALGVALAVVVLVAVRMVRKLIEEKTASQMLREREHLLYTDNLTGFHNRNYFSQWAKADVEDGFPQAVVVADMNNLKWVNDSHGHASGDQLLRLFADTARAQWPDAHAFRFGGDEFVFILPRCNEAQVQAGIDALRKRCAQTRSELAPGVLIRPSASMGYAVRHQRADPLHHCIATADESMYAVKAQARRRRSDWSDSLV